MKKFLFPFYKERHEFLVQKWWFRVVLLAYFIWLAISPFYFGLSYLSSQTEWCYASAQLNYQISSQYDNNYKEIGDTFSNELEECSKMAREHYLPSIGVGLVGAPIVHYLAQFFFFVVLMDFIVLGTRFKRRENTK